MQCDVMQAADGLRLALEARHRRLRFGDRLMQELDRDELAELDALGPIDDAHAAGAQLVDDFPTAVDYFAHERVARRRLARHRPAV